MPEKKKVKLKLALEDINAICNAKARKVIRHIINETYHGHVDNATLLKYFKARDYLINGINFNTLEMRIVPAQPNYTASRVSLDSTFTEENIEKKITDTGIQTILKRHLKHYVDDKGKCDCAAAFSPEGIAEMNEHLTELNGDVAPAMNAKGDKLLFVLSPGDLVYLPQEGEHVALPLDENRIYKMVSCSVARSYFVPYCSACMISDKIEYGPLNKMERSLDGIMIKTTCIKLKVDRLGHISV